MKWILDWVTFIPINFILKILGYEITGTSNIEFSCQNFLFYPTPQQFPFIVGYLEINNLSSAKDVIKDVVLEIKNNKYMVKFYNPFPGKSLPEFIYVPFQVAPRGEGYYKKSLYFDINPSHLQLVNFTDGRDNLKPIPAKIIINKATSKKDYIFNISINLASGDQWLTNTGVTHSNPNLYNEHI